MRTKRPMSVVQTEQATIDKARDEARQRLATLTTRLDELTVTAERAIRFDVFAIDDYAAFKRDFFAFRTLCEEFQALSEITKSAIDRLETCGRRLWGEADALRAQYHDLQVPLMRTVLYTSLHLLVVWEDRLTNGDGLPIGAHEMFLDTLHTINRVRSELLRPRYLAALDDATLADAERVEKVLRTLMGQAPTLLDFPAAAGPLPAAEGNDAWAKLDAFFLKLRHRD
jgi:hypothetical protein